jgi:Fur family transcriptional regulator, stress-responsive regulator
MNEEPAALLRRHGVQVTAQRLAVLAAVSERPHGTANEIATAVRAEIGVISRQAVYDALAVLADEGLIRRIRPAGSPARYEGRTGDNHHHLICRACGRMVDVDCAVGAAPCLTPADDAGYEIDEAEVIYWGRCPDCLARDRGRPGSEEATVAPPRRPHASGDGDVARATAHDQTDEAKGEPACQTKPASAR